MSPYHTAVRVLRTICSPELTRPGLLKAACGSRLRPIASAVLLFSMLLLSGCGSKPADGDVVEDDIPEIETKELARKTVATIEGAPIPQAPAAPSVELALNVGDRFPLIKTVEQELIQYGPDGQPVSTSRSFLEFLLTISVDEIHSGPQIPADDPKKDFKRLQVRYHRVRFEQELPGRRVSYDSHEPPAKLPVEVLGYHGLVDNSLHFWMDSDNQIREMVGFDQFLDRCLKEVPEQKRRQVRENLAATSGADGIANFVDDSLGVLPGAKVRPGDSWTRERLVLQPVPMHLKNRYTLKDVHDQIADLDIAGTITPSVTYHPADNAQRDVQVTIQSGHTLGNCQIDRRTGLPSQSRVRQDLKMRVRVPGEQEFLQTRSTTTTISLFLAQGQGSGKQSGAETAHLEQPDSRTSGAIVIPASGSAPPSASVRESMNPRAGNRGP